MHFSSFSDLERHTVLITIWLLSLIDAGMQTGRVYTACVTNICFLFLSFPATDVRACRGPTHWATVQDRKLQQLAGLVSQGRKKADCKQHENDKKILLMV